MHWDRILISPKLHLSEKRIRRSLKKVPIVNIEMSRESWHQLMCQKDNLSASKSVRVVPKSHSVKPRYPRWLSTKVVSKCWRIQGGSKETSHSFRWSQRLSLYLYRSSRLPNWATTRFPHCCSSWSHM